MPASQEFSFEDVFCVLRGCCPFIPLKYGQFLLSRLLLAWRDIGVRISVRLFIRPSTFASILTFSRTTWARVMILGTNFHLGMTTYIWVSRFDLDLYFTVHWLGDFCVNPRVNPNVQVHFSRTTWARVLILGTNFHLRMSTYIWVSRFDRTTFIGWGRGWRNFPIHSKSTFNVFHSEASVV